MPIYAYQCTACGHEMEALQKMSDAPLRDCPECKSASLQKQVTAAAFRLSGSGWYETDFKKDGKKNLTESASTPAKPAEPSPAPAATTPTSTSGTKSA